MKWLKTFVGGILAGISIAIGGTVFLSLDNKVLGALFFTVGLFAVCTFGFNLYTGKALERFQQIRLPLRLNPDHCHMLPILICFRRFINGNTFNILWR